MTVLPLIRDTEPGFAQNITDTTSSDAITVPDGALGVVLWFEDGDGAIIGGRVGIDQADTSVDPITDTNMGWHPPMPVEYEFLSALRSGIPYRYRDDYLHVGSDVAGAVAKGMFLFAYDTDD